MHFARKHTARVASNAGSTYSSHFWLRSSGSASSGVILNSRHARAHWLRTARKSELPAGKITSAWCVLSGSSGALAMVESLLMMKVPDGSAALKSGQTMVAVLDGSVLRVRDPSIDEAMSLMDNLRLKRPPSPNASGEDLVVEFDRWQSVGRTLVPRA